MVVAIGLALTALGSYLVTLGGGAQFSAGGVFSAGGGFLPYGLGLKPWLRLMIWLVLIGTWAVASVRVLRPSPERTKAISEGR